MFKVVKPQITADSSNEVIKSLCDDLIAFNCVEKSYTEAVLAREISFPTGLDVDGKIKVAIPHADIEFVKSAQIAFASLQRPINFQSMACDGSTVSVSLVFLLAVKNPEDQVDVLQQLMNLFEKEDILKYLAAETNVNKIKEVLEKELLDGRND